MLSQEQKEKESKLEIFIPAGPRLGTNVIDAKNVKKGFGDKLLYDDLNFTCRLQGLLESLVQTVQVKPHL